MFHKGSVKYNQNSNDINQKRSKNWINTESIDKINMSLGCFLRFFEPTAVSDCVHLELINQLGWIESVKVVRFRYLIMKINRKKTSEEKVKEKEWEKDKRKRKKIESKGERRKEIEKDREQ